MAAMLSPGANRYARRPPPRPTRTSMASRKASKTKAIHKAISSTSQMQCSINTSTSHTTTETTNPLPSTPQLNRATPANSSPGPNTEPSPGSFTLPSAAISTPGSQSLPTPTQSVTQPIPTDNSPGGQSSRQSNDVNEMVDAGNSQEPTCQGDMVDQSVAGKPWVSKHYFLNFNVYNCNSYNNTFILFFVNPAPKKNVRNKTVGYGLEKYINRGNKLAIEVLEGKKRLKVPL